MSSQLAVALVLVAAAILIFAVNRHGCGDADHVDAAPDHGALNMELPGVLSLAGVDRLHDPRFLAGKSARRYAGQLHVWRFIKLGMPLGMMVLVVSVVMVL